MYSTWQNTMYLIRTIWAKDKKLFFAMIVQSPLAVVIPLIGITLPKIILDYVSIEASLVEILIGISVPIGFLILLMTLRSALAGWTQLRKIGFRMNFLNMMADKLLDTDYENIDGAEGMKRYSKANEATTNNSAATEHIVIVVTTALTNILGLLLYSSIIITLHPVLVGFVVIASGINYYIGLRVNRYVHSNKEAVADIERKIQYVTRTGGAFKSAKDLRLYNMGAWFKDNYADLLKGKVRLDIKNDHKKFLARLVDGILILLRDALTYGVLVYFVLYRGLGLGDFALYFGAVAGLSGWLSGIAGNLTEFNAMSLEVNNLRDYLEMKDRSNRSNGIEIPPKETWPFDIELRNVSFRYKGADRNTIDKLNLHIRKGEKLALVGVNGAGKTTIVKLICGLYLPTEGEILLNGKPVTDYNREDYYSLFSVVFQDCHMLPLSIEENITLKHSHEMSDKDKSRVDAILEQAGLSSKVSRLKLGKNSKLVKSVYEDAIELSGGELQKLILAQALYKNAPMMILDEPTAALDPIAENEIYQQYDALTKSHTSLYISHRLSSTRFCDRIVFLEDGRIVEMGSHEELMKEETRYKRMYDVQSHYYKSGGEASA